MSCFKTTSRSRSVRWLVGVDETLLIENSDSLLSLSVELLEMVNPGFVGAGLALVVWENGAFSPFILPGCVC